MGVVLFILFIALAESGLSQTVAEVDGSIRFIDSNGKTWPITTTGLDSAPSLSPDHQRIVFVRRTPGRPIETGIGDAEENELWVARVDGRGAPRRVLTGRPGGFDPRGRMVLAGFSAPQFSTDGSRIYFLAQTWATAAAIHFLDLKTGETKFLFPGLGVDVIKSGKYRGFLIALKDPITQDRGRIDEYWLLTPEGKQVLRLGETEEDVTRFKRSAGVQ